MGDDIRAHFPERIGRLEEFEGPFDAFRLQAQACEVLFATYPAGTDIAAHTHDTDNVGVITAGALYLTVDGAESVVEVGEWYRVDAGVEHSARFESDSAEIEFWFDPDT